MIAATLEVQTGTDRLPTLVQLLVAWHAVGLSVRRWKADSMRITADLYEVTAGRSWTLQLPDNPVRVDDKVIAAYMIELADAAVQVAPGDLDAATAALQAVQTAIAQRQQSMQAAVLQASNDQQLAARPQGVRARGFTVREGYLCTVLAPDVEGFAMTALQVIGAWEVVPVADVLAEREPE